MSTGYTEKTIHLVQFSGKNLDWQMWNKKILAMSGKKGYKEVLTGKVTVPAATETPDASTTDGKKQLKARTDNESAYHDLILSNPDRIAFNIVNKATTTDLPDGDAALAWANLSTKYDSKSATTVANLSREFNNAELKSLTIDPEDWIVELEILKSRLDDMDFPITDKHLLVHILRNVPEEYNSVVEADEKLLNDPTNPLTLHILRTNLHSKWEKLVHRKKIEINKDDDETIGEALIGSQFKGRCRFCGVIGHKAANCRKNPKNKNNSDDRESSKKYKKFGAHGSGF